MATAALAVLQAPHLELFFGVGVRWVSFFFLRKGPPSICLLFFGVGQVKGPPKLFFGGGRLPGMFLFLKVHLFFCIFGVRVLRVSSFRRTPPNPPPQNGKPQDGLGVGKVGVSFVGRPTIFWIWGGGAPRNGVFCPFLSKKGPPNAFIWGGLPGMVLFFWGLPKWSCFLAPHKMASVSLFSQAELGGTWCQSWSPAA